MTEDEAKTKQCCGPRFAALVSTIVAHPEYIKASNLGPGEANCIGSGCMAWRWTPGKQTEAFEAAAIAHAGRCAGSAPPIERLREIVWSNSEGQAKFPNAMYPCFDRLEGHCGLAGQP